MSENEFKGVGFQVKPFRSTLIGFSAKEYRFTNLLDNPLLNQLGQLTENRLRNDTRRQNLMGN